MEIRLVFFPGTASDFGAFQQPIRFIICGSEVVRFGGNHRTMAVPECKNSSHFACAKDARRLTGIFRNC
jgi:hypothetical protein